MIRTVLFLKWPNNNIQRRSRNAPPFAVSMIFYHSYPQLLHLNWCLTFWEKIPNKPTLAALDSPEIFLVFVLPQVGQVIVG